MILKRLAGQSIDETERFGDVNETVWKRERLGKATGASGNAFENIRDKRLSHPNSPGS